MSLSGYDTADRFWATRYRQGGRTIYALDLSLAQIASYLPRPDPSRATDDNRRVSETHARGFATYVRTTTNWVAPALLLRAPDIFTFELKEEVAGAQFGVLALPRLAKTELRILDGQHRILGLHMAVEDIARQLTDKRGLLAQARRGGDEVGAAAMEQAVRRLEEERARLDAERMSVQVVVEDDPVLARQAFVDIARNAKGITQAVQARFDMRKIANRCLDEVLKHALLRNHVDMEQDRVGSASPNLMGAKHVTDIIRSVAVGVEGRITTRREDELDEAALVQQTNDFLDVLLEAFPDLEGVADDRVSSEQLRKTSLLGSTTMLRVLAGVYHELVKSRDDEEIVDYFRRLAPLMAAPVTKTSLWVRSKQTEPLFTVGATAPTARTQDLKKLRDVLVQWAAEPPSGLPQAPGVKKGVGGHA